jgi:hypothetical protein
MTRKMAQSILHPHWMKGRNIKHIMSHGQSGLQGEKRTAGQGVMSSCGNGLGGEGRAGEAV